MTIKLYYKGNEYDLTQYVDLTDNSLSDTIEEQLDSGKIVLSRVAKNVFIGLDMSKRVPSYVSYILITKRVLKELT